MPLFRHTQAAFQFSGGKDSLAALHLLRPYWDKFTVYWLNTGDAVPEVEECVMKIAAEVPRFVEVHGKQPEQTACFGWPVDVLPSSTTLFGRTASSQGVLFRDRNECCFASLMLPLHAKMKEDGITLIIRGQKLADTRKSPVHSGDVVEGVEYYFPLETWSNEDVLMFLEDRGVTLPEFYSQLQASPDCLHCTAYWDEKRKVFLQTRYPKVWEFVKEKLHCLQQEIEISRKQLEEFFED